MKFELYELEDMSGEKTKIFSPMLEGDDETLYERFATNNYSNYPKEIQNIYDRLVTIGKEAGLFQDYFKTGAGKFGQNLCSLRDRPRSLLRLYFIEFGETLIILGGGGAKPKSARTTQEVPILEHEKNVIGKISETMQKAIKLGHFGIDENGNIFSTTGFTYNTDHYE